MGKSGDFGRNGNQAGADSYANVLDILSPVLVYAVVTTLVMTLLTLLADLLKWDYTRQYMMLQTVAVTVTIPFIYRYYQRDRGRPTAFFQEMILELSQKSTNQKIGNGILMFAIGAFTGMVLNNLLAMTGILELSKGYQEVTGRFYGGGIFFELLGVCLMTPVLEELLYRGVVFTRICDLSLSNRKKSRSRILAMLASAFLFGGMHGNLVQFVYAGLLGILLAWCMEKAGHLYGPILAHMGANLLSVLGAETQLFAWMDVSKAVFAGTTAGLILVSGILILAVNRKNPVQRR